MLLALLGSAACAGADSATAPTPTDAPCAGALGAGLEPLHGVAFDCSRGTTIALPGDRATYLVVAELAAGDTDPTPVPYSISVPGAGVLDRVPVAMSASRATLPGPAAGPAASGRQQAFDAALRARAPRYAAAGGGAPASPAPRASGIPEVGSVRSFHVLATTDFSHERYAPVSARLAYAGANLLLYLDSSAPAGGFDDAQLSALGALFDQVLYPLDLATFGSPSDIDGNGRLIMLLSPVVNALVPPGACGPGGYIAGFVTGNDLVKTDTTSNRGEVFYAMVPDPAARYSCAHSRADVEALLGSTFLHETQHLISYSQHVLVNRGDPGAGWMDEGMSLVAEELGAVYYEDAARTRPAAADSARPFLANLAASAYGYLLGPDTTSLTLHSDSDPGTQWRGGDWLLLRWLGDQKGGADFYRALTQSRARGIAAIEAAAHESFPALFADFAVALYADSLPGLARGAAAGRTSFRGRSLWQLFQATSLLRATGADSGFPLQPHPLTGATAATLLPGGIAYYRVASAPGTDTVRLRFSTPGGAPLPAKLHPQLSVFRLP